ncbi:MAG: phosphoribosylaminoimidazolecarboxamide formyltransferase/IMP cyclohydrolase [Sphingobacteriales bacterium]|jgi:phosphoribosylaminoimidazolecarboxamide formyltransferase/IMP cyclohydrolase
MNSTKSIKNALISVYYKDQLGPLVQKLSSLGVEIYSTGGTQKFINDLGIEVNPVEDLTSYPSILGGRVKTLHPKVFGGILGRREEAGDLAQLEEYNIPEFDLVIVDLYPFEETVASGAPEQDIIEKIDIGGISLIRAAAKNFKDVTILSSKDQYNELLTLLEDQEGKTSIDQRKRFAMEAFNVSSHYDTAIFNYFNGEFKMPAFKQSSTQAKTLRYGENPHQKGEFFGNLDGMLEKLGGKELSYNNLVDADAAVNLISEFTGDPTFVVIKHTNACGVATRPTVLEAWNDALAGDPVSAFGGVLITNATVDIETAEEINKLFYEILIAPNYTDEALALLSKKAKRCILKQVSNTLPDVHFKTCLNGVIVQDRDAKMATPDELEVKTEVAPTAQEIKDLMFANRLVKHTKSNTIILAKGDQLLASGVGQTSRVDALKQAIIKAKSFNFDLNGAVMASDAFFPFPDCVAIASEAGITAVIQPGGSIKDVDSINACNERKMSMVFTGLRHFKH